MTIKELVDKLNKYDPNVEVVVADLQDVEILDYGSWIYITEGSA